jgi:uncharacterized repeat protein (TIGR03803 family)
MNLKTSKRYFCAAAACAALVALSSGAQAARFHLLYTFHGADGSSPWAAPILDASGNLYGTTHFGGSKERGTVYKLAPDGSETVLSSFEQPRSGYAPLAPLWRDANGNLFGTTFQEAKRRKAGPGGVLFEISPDGSETVLHHFSPHGPAGVALQSGVIGDAQGNLYSIGSFGGEEREGTVFKYAPDGKISVLHAFSKRHHDGMYPIGTMALDAAGNLYGTTERGGAFNAGTVWRIAPDGTESILHSFNAMDDGETPNGVLLDAAGNLYGTTSGSANQGDGTVYRLAPDGTETVLHGFSRYPDGAEPNGGLVADSKGNLYGTTLTGGGPTNCGTLFEVSPKGDFHVLHTFDAIARRLHNGIQPMGALAIDASGNLYGTTSTGGGKPGAPLYGTVFKFDAK